MDTLESAVRLMRPGCFMSSIDLRNAYYSIPISPSFRQYLKFVQRSLMFQFCALSMGLTISPRIFTKVLKPVFSALRTQYGHNCLGYIDDSFYKEDLDDARREATLRAAQLFTRLGFVIHPTVCFSPCVVSRILEVSVGLYVYDGSLKSKKGGHGRCFVSESFACPGILYPLNCLMKFPHR